MHFKAFKITGVSRDDGEFVRDGASRNVQARAPSFKGTIQLYSAFGQQLRFTVGASARTMTAHPLSAISLCSDYRFAQGALNPKPSNDDRKGINC